MALNEIKKQVVLMFQSVLSLDSSGRSEAMGFLKDCAVNFGLEIPNTEKLCDNNSKLNETGITKHVGASSLPGIKEDEKFWVEDDKEAMGFLKDCAVNFGLEIPNTEKLCDNNSKLNETEITKYVDASSFPGIKEEEFWVEDDKNSSSDDQKLNSEQSLSAGTNATDSFLKVDSKTERYSEKKNNEDNSKKVEETETSQLQSDEISSKKITKTKKRVNKVKVKTKVLNSSKSPNESRNVKKKLKTTKREDQENENEVFKCPGCSVTCNSKQALLLHFSSHSKAPMSCRLCRSSFNDILHFWRHQKKSQCKILLFKCTECGEKFKYRRHYLKHILGHNDNNCRYCEEKFSTWILYKHHLKEKHPNIKMERDLIPCKFCAMSFRRHFGLYNHYQVEHSKGKFVCLSCGILLPTKEKYKEHALVHESEKTWKCKICKMKFYRRQQLLFHVSVHKSGTYKCLTCNITVTSKADLYKHKKEGHEVKGLEPKFECEICHKNFKKKVVLKNHMATHSNEKKYYCKYCVKSFSTLDALQKHEKRKSHFEKAKIILPESKYEKVYEDKLICENCGKQYKTQRELTWHLRVHKSIYECDECGKTFTLKVNLTKHIKLHRNKVCVICELCGNTFNQLSALNEHNLMKHSDVRNAECEVCKKKFKRKSELNRHKRIHEPKRPFVCFCGTAFKQSSHLQTHFRNFHEKTTEQPALIQPVGFEGGESTEVFNETVMDGRKQVYVKNESETLLSLENVEPDNGFRNTNSYENIQVNGNDDGKGTFVNTYNLRYSQNDMDPINVTYDELHFGNSQPDKRGLVFSSPAVDLSMVAISEVVQNDMTLGHRDLAESVEPYNKMPDDPSNIQLVNLSEHIVQEYLLNLP